MSNRAARKFPELSRKSLITQIHPPRNSSVSFSIEGKDNLRAEGTGLLRLLLARSEKLGVQRLGLLATEEVGLEGLLSAAHEHDVYVGGKVTSQTPYK